MTYTPSGNDFYGVSAPSEPLTDKVRIFDLEDLKTYSDVFEKPAVDMWLAAPGHDLSSAVYQSKSGTVMMYGDDVTDMNLSVCPVITVDLKARTGSSKSTGSCQEQDTVTAMTATVSASGMRCRPRAGYCGGNDRTERSRMRGCPGGVLQECRGDWKREAKENCRWAASGRIGSGRSGSTGICWWSWSLKYRRSVLGYIWSVLNPLLIMVVMTVVFSAMFKKNIENYPIYLLTGRVLFEFMRMATQNGLKSVTNNASLLKKTYIPKYIFTLSKVTSTMIDSVFSLGAFFIVMIATRSAFYWTMLYLVVIIMQVYIFSLGLTFLLAALEVFFRDMEYIYHAFITAWMYLTPLFYPIENLPHLLQVIIKGFNPMYYYIAAFRDITLAGRMPGPRLVVGGWLWAFAALVLGLYVFQKKKDEFILHI